MCVCTLHTISIFSYNLLFSRLGEGSKKGGGGIKERLVVITFVFGSVGARELHYGSVTMFINQSRESLCWIDRTDWQAFFGWSVLFYSLFSILVKKAREGERERGREERRRGEG